MNQRKNMKHNITGSNLKYYKTIEHQSFIMGASSQSNKQLHMQMKNEIYAWILNRYAVCRIEFIASFTSNDTGSFDGEIFAV